MGARLKDEVLLRRIWGFILTLGLAGVQRTNENGTRLASSKPQKMNARK